MALDESQIEAHPFILLQATKYYQLASALLLLYDYILTFDLEIEAVWSAKKLNFAKLLFILNRYFPLFFYIWIVVETHRKVYPSSEECTIFLHAPFVMVTLSELVIIMMVTQRIYAIYLRSRYILAFLVILGGVHICLDVIAATSVIPLLTISLPITLPLGCLITIKKDSYPLFAVLWGWNVIFDFSILILTLLRTLKLRNENSFSLFDLLCRDGIIYFVVMFSAKLMNFILFTRISINLITVNWAFNHIITVIMISRLFLNIHLEGSRQPVIRSNSHANITTSI